MNSSTSREFWALYRRLPERVREEARKAYRHWQRDSQHPTLHFKKVREVWSVRIGQTGYRALATSVSGGYLWFWIGPHDGYLRLLRGG